jgi:hypothetical protein
VLLLLLMLLLLQCVLVEPVPCVSAYLTARPELSTFITASALCCSLLLV